MRPWESIQWIDQWKTQDEGSSICHVLALMELAGNDDSFYFNEMVHH
jgi:hypothetical protein